MPHTFSMFTFCFSIDFSADGMELLCSDVGAGAGAPYWHQCLAKSLEGATPSPAESCMDLV